MFIYVDRSTNLILAAFNAQPDEGPENTDLIETDEVVEPGRTWDRASESMAPMNAEQQARQDEMDAFIARRQERLELRGDAALKQMMNRRPAQLRNMVRSAFTDPDQAAVVEKMLLGLIAVAGDVFDG